MRSLDIFSINDKFIRDSIPNIINVFNEKGNLIYFSTTTNPFSLFEDIFNHRVKQIIHSKDYDVGTLCKMLLQDYKIKLVYTNKDGDKELTN